MTGGPQARARADEPEGLSAHFLDEKLREAEQLLNYAIETGTQIDEAEEMGDEEVVDVR